MCCIKLTNSLFQQAVLNRDFSQAQENSGLDVNLSLASRINIKFANTGVKYNNRLQFVRTVMNLYCHQ